MYLKWIAEEKQTTETVGKILKYYAGHDLVFASIRE
jgi:hypothetical protein